MTGYSLYKQSAILGTIYNFYKGLILGTRIFLSEKLHETCSNSQPEPQTDRGTKLTGSFVLAAPLGRNGQTLGAYGADIHMKLGYKTKKT